MEYLKRKFDFPARYVLTMWCFLGYVVSYTMIVNLSVVIVAMVNNNPMNVTEEKISSPIVCKELFMEFEKNASYSRLESYGEFDWDRKTQSNVLGAFFYGVLVSRLPGGILSDRWSAKWTIGLSTFLGSLLSLLSPLAARWSVDAFIAIRAMIGLTQGVLLPSFISLIGRWAPKIERSSMLAVISCGVSIGSVIGLTISGFLSNSNIWGGWPSAFYVSGTLGCVWCVFWIFIIHDTPEEHPRISTSELLYITENKITLKVAPQIPWISILTSVRVWAIIVAFFGNNWCFYTLFNLMPTYLANILHFSIEKNGVLSSMPHILFALSMLLVGYVGDKMRQQGKYSVTTIHKIFSSIGLFGPGLFILLVAFVGCRPAVSILFLCIALGLLGANVSGFGVTHVDMSPQFAGIISGVVGSITTSSGFLAPYVAGRITSNGETLQNWGMVFGITAGVAFISGLFFNVFASAELQSWNSPVEGRIRKESVKLENDLDRKN